MEINDIVNVQITRQTQAVDTVAFNIAMMMVHDIGTPIYEDDGSGGQVEVGRTYKQELRVVEYSGLKAVGEVFGTDSIAYLKMQKQMSNDIKPNRIKIGVVRETESVTQALQEILEYDSEWYAMTMESHIQGDIIAVAGVIQGLDKLFFTSSSDVDILDPASTTDVAQQLNDAGYFRTILMYSPVADSQFPEDSWVGGQLSKTIGSVAWEYKSLAGVPVTRGLTDNQIATLQRKECNYYLKIKGVNVTRRGKTTEGAWIDEIQVMDWLKARLQETVFGAFVRNDKIPFTQEGISMIEALMRSVFQMAQVNGAIDTYSLISPKVYDIPENDRINRIAGDFKFTARMASAISVVNIRGILTY